MIYKQPSGNAGEYYPAFFEMRLNVDHMIDLNTCANAEFALFFHEYIPVSYYTSPSPRDLSTSRMPSSA